jgi:hypothetical protein
MQILALLTRKNYEPINSAAAHMLISNPCLEDPTYIGEAGYAYST